MTVHPRKQKILDIFGKEPESLDELGQCVIQVANTYKPYYYTDKPIQTKVLGLKWEIRRGDVSNSHSCPLNGHTNWSNRNKELPSSYRGWSGRVWLRVNSSRCATALDGTLTYTGTGGYGAYNGPWCLLSRMTNANIYSWDYRFFEDDWPLIKEQYEMQQTFDILKDGKVQPQSHIFLWEDPEIVESDREIGDDITNA
jgi:hypothetical protein